MPLPRSSAWTASTSSTQIVNCRTAPALPRATTAGAIRPSASGAVEEVDHRVAELDDGGVGVLVDDGLTEHVLVPRLRSLDIVDEQGVIAPMMLAVGITFSRVAGRVGHRSHTVRGEAHGPARQARPPVSLAWYGTIFANS